MSEDDWPIVECAICGEDVSLEHARSGFGGKPVHGDCFTSQERCAGDGG